MTQVMQETAAAAVREPPRACYLCNYWYPGRVALRTDTTGACLCMGSPYDMPKAEDVCDLWEAAQ